MKVQLQKNNEKRKSAYAQNETNKRTVGPF